MPRCLLFLLVAAAAVVSPALSQPAPAFSPSDKTAVENVINGYFQAFTDKNYDRIRDSFQAPFFGFSGGSVLARSLEDTVKSYRKLRESLSATDYAVSKVAEMRITALANETALVNIHWQRLKKDGSLFGEGSEIMVVTKTSGGWKICGSLGQNLADFGKQY